MGYLNNTVAASRATPLPQTLATYPRRLVVALLLVLSALAAGLLLFGSLLVSGDSRAATQYAHCHAHSAIMANAVGACSRGRVCCQSMDRGV